MKCQILFSGKNKKNNIILSSAENAQRVVKVKKKYLMIILVKTYIVGIHMKHLNKALLISTGNMCFYGELRKTVFITKYSSLNPLWTAKTIIRLYGCTRSSKSLLHVIKYIISEC